MGFPGGSMGKESTCQYRRCRMDPWVRKIPWRREWQPTPVFLPGESHEQGAWRATDQWGSQRVRHDGACTQAVAHHRGSPDPSKPPITHRLLLLRGFPRSESNFSNSFATQGVVCRPAWLDSECSSYTQSLGPQPRPPKVLRHFNKMLR